MNDRTATQLEPWQGRERSSATTWALILGFGGAAWFITSLCTVLWLWPKSGTMVGDQYYLSTPARVLQNFAVFTVAALAYRYAFSATFPHYRQSRWRYIATHVALAALVIRVSPLATGMVTGLVDGYWDQGLAILGYWRPLSLPWVAWSSVLQFFLPPYLLGLTFIAMASALHAYHHESVRAARLAAAYSEAQLAMLSARLQPHFLLNALNAISELMIQSPLRAQIVVARLGEFLRHALESSKMAWSPVDREIDSVRSYLAIQRARFGGELEARVEVDGGAERQYVPSMVLQPLVENAVEHGRLCHMDRLSVVVRVERRTDRLRIVITNSVPRLPGPLLAKQFGNGLNNVALRIQAAYGSSASLQVGPGPHGTDAVLELPCPDPASPRPAAQVAETAPV